MSHSSVHALSRALLWIALGTACAPPPPVDPNEALSGGDTTVFDTSRSAYSLAARNLPPAERRAFAVGNNFFSDNWVIAPSSTSGRDGLGPLYNALSCGSCHLFDGRGQPPEPGEEMLSMLVRLSIPGSDPHGGPLGDPVYGGQLQPRSIPGVPPEAHTSLSWEESSGSYVDGEPYSLRRPHLELSALGYGPMDPQVMTSLRVAPPVYGLGLLEAISEETLLSLTDPADADGDGISGRVNRVWDPLAGRHAVGRFGWKAGQPGLRQQSAAAFLGDIGITTTLLPAPSCTPAQLECAAAPDGGDPECEEDILDAIELYCRALAVPARRDLDDPEVRRGRSLFSAAGCDRCHLPLIVTGDHPLAAVRHQSVRPYTDLLLHDLGEGLADHRPEHEASGSEWRTPPLWGIGLLQTVNRHQLLLHDGRARGFAEAILWHGGEAQSAMDAFRTMSSDERRALLRFLESL